VWHLPVSFTPFIQEIRDYNFTLFRYDFLAALAVALLTIPQSIAYSLLAGLPPVAGIFSAIFGTIFSAAFGSSKQLVSGPSTGVAILIQTAIADILYSNYELITGAAKDALALQLLTQIVLIIGLIQIGSAFFNVRKLLRFVSRSVMLGYFAGITIAITVNQLYYLFGVGSPVGEVSIFAKAFFFVSHFLEWNPTSLFIGLVSFAVLFFFRRKFKNWPDALFTLIAASLLSDAFRAWHLGTPVLTLGDLHFIESLIPQFTLPLVDIRSLNKIFPAAAAIAFLSILEVFSISKNFAARTGSQEEVNQDVFGVGIGNFFLSFLTSAML